jgi:outer membrane protein, heavy metal efflux system
MTAAISSSGCGSGSTSPGREGSNGARRQQNLDGQYARIEMERRALVREIRGLYYDVVAARQRLEAQRDWHARLKQLVTAVEARRQAGDAARYDAVRLRQELALVSARLREARAAFESARETLFDLIDAEPVDLTGGLLPPEASAAPAEILAGIHVASVAGGSRQCRYPRKAARRDAWPDLTLGIGRREFQEGEIDAQGGLIAIGVEVPLFNRSRGESQDAESEARALRAEASLERSRLQARIGEAERLLAARRAAVHDLQREIASDGGSLSAMAEAAYTAGEIDVMALIDAHRTELAMAGEITALARAARAAYIQLQYLSGDP